MTQNRLFLVVLLAATCLAAPTVFATHTGHADHSDGQRATMHGVLAHYETVRQTLVRDTVDGTADEATAITEGLAALHHEFDPATAEVDAASKDKALDLLGQMHAAAAALGEAAQGGDLVATRAAFYELTKPLVQYRELMTGDKPDVAYCPMHQKSWLQNDDQIGNPYAGQSMPTCGSVVSGGR